MKRSMYYLIILQSLLLVASSSYANHWIGIGVQSGERDLLIQKSQLEAQGHSVSILKDLTGKFENDNTFVHLYPHSFQSDKIKVANKDVFLALPFRLTSDTLMETLIKVRAARTFGANVIDIRTEYLLQTIQIEGIYEGDLNLKNLLASAGSDFFSVKNVKQNFAFRKTPRNPVTQEGFWIGGAQPSALLNDLAGLLGKRPVTLQELKANSEKLKGRRIYWMAHAHPPVNENFFTTLAQISWMTQKGASVHLISPYLFYARSDKPEFDVGSTTQGRLMADLIESVGTQGITVVHAHAPQSLGFFKIHSNEISGIPTIVKYLKSQKVECVISPDAGFQKNATKYQQKLSLAYGAENSVCLAVMNKERNSEGKERILGGTGLESIRDKHIVIIDDETSSGGTLSQVAQVLQTYKPKSIFAVVTHLAGPAQKALNSEAIQKLIVTNTVPIKIDHPKLEVLSIASEIANSIHEEEK